jgi:hypothetical protein
VTGEWFLGKIDIIFGGNESSLGGLKSFVRKQPDMNVLDFEGDTGIGLLLAVQELEPDVVVLELPDDGREPGICSHLLEEFNDLVVITVSPSTIHRLSKSCVLSFSKKVLLETIRTATGAHPAA